MSPSKTILIGRPPGLALGILKSALVLNLRVQILQLRAVSVPDSFRYGREYTIQGVQQVLVASENGFHGSGQTCLVHRKEVAGNEAHSLASQCGLQVRIAMADTRLSSGSGNGICVNKVVWPALGSRTYWVGLDHNHEPANEAWVELVV